MGLNVDLQSAGVTIQEFNLIQELEQPYWHTTILDHNQLPLAGGFGPSQNISRKIAYSEYLERMTVRDIKKSPQQVIQSWGLDLIPSACGFAAGFNQRNVILRSIGEALERWAMSKWIDDHYWLEPKKDSDVLKRLGATSRWFCNQFDSVHFYQEKMLVPFGPQICSFFVSITVGIKDNGVYLGSNSSLEERSIWDHALLESFRHLSIVKNGKETNTFPDNKVRFFSKNKGIALYQIEQAHIREWPLPIISIHKHEYFPEKDFHLARTIISGWEPRHKGPITRFLY